MTIRSEQVKNKSGAFFLQDPIPFDGTIVTVTASGYCSTTEDMLELQLILYDGKTISKNADHRLFVNCTEVSGDSNVTIGRVETNKKIAVRGGHYLGILYIQCRQAPCAFLPAVDDNHVVQQFVFFEDVKLHNFNTSITGNGVGLQFSYTIERGETLYMLHSIDYYVIKTQISVIMKAFHQKRFLKHFYHYLLAS